MALALATVLTVALGNATSRLSAIEPEKVFRGHREAAGALAFSPDGRWLASGGFDHTVQLWSLDREGALARFDGHEGKVLDLDFDAAGERLLSASEDGSLRLWRLPAPGPRVVLELSGELQSLAHCARPSFLIAASAKEIALQPLSEGVAPVTIDLPQGLLASAHDARSGSLYLALGDGGLYRRRLGAAYAEPSAKLAAGELTLLATEGKWRYFKGREAPPKGWSAPDFDAGAWAEGVGGFGYSSNAAELATVKTRLDDMKGDKGYRTLFLRQAFELVDPAAVESLTLELVYDDGFVAYLNGVEVARRNVEGEAPGHRQLAKASGEPEKLSVDLAAERTKLRAGRNVLALQGHNQADTSSDFVLTASLRAVVAARAAPAPASEKLELVARLDAIASHLALAPEGGRVATLQGEKLVVFDAVAGKVVGEPTVVGPARGLAMRDRRHILVHTQDGRLREFGGETVRELGAAEGFALSGDRRVLAVLANSGTVRVLEAATGELIRELEPGEPAVELSLGQKGELVAVRTREGELRSWRGDRPADLLELATRDGEATRGLLAEASGRYFALAGSRVLGWAPGPGGELRQLQGHAGPVFQVALAPDGRRAVSAGADKTLRIWDLAEGKELRKIEAQKTSLYATAWSPAAEVVASGAYDGTIKLHDPRDGRELATAQGHREGVIALVFSPEGETLHSASFDGSVRTWSTRDGSAGPVYEGHAAWIYGLARLPGRAELLSVDFSGELLHWKLGEAQPIARQKLGGLVFSMALAPDGRTLAAAARDGTIGLYRLDR